MDQRRRIKKELKNRRRKADTKRVKAPSGWGYQPNHDEMPSHEPEFYAWREAESDQDSYSVRFKQRFLLQWLSSLLLFLLMGMLFQSTHPALQSTQATVEEAMTEHFQFAAVSHWYEERFGSPLAFFPEPSETPGVPEEELESVPVSEHVSTSVLEEFDENGTGVLLQPINDNVVHSVTGGFVIHVGTHEEWDRAVAIQHPDGHESWYGYLSEESVRLYDHVEAGQPIGEVNDQDDVYSLAVEKDDEYVDPMEVMSFD
ncbi:M23 family metallopeptidase [Salsuginibacillus kocurii]|uniref:M23 family metallopeptidase n=1 Tax=Salsuginibacillus kocurii TaxID=427078 RepID=UPI0003716339|nr:M23 family metallopeptidase [Salsuginibacillus kocurii]